MARSPDQLSSGRNATPDALILESMDVAVMAVDQSCRVTRFNPLAEQLTGVAGSAILGQPCYEHLQAGPCPRTCPLRESLATRTSGRIGVVVLQPADQAAVPVEMTASALFGRHDELLGAVAILRQMSSSLGANRFYGSRLFASVTPQMRHIFESLPRLASSDAPLLVVGPKGAGRAALAECVHGLRRRDESPPFLRIQCADRRKGRSMVTELGEDFAERLHGGTLLLEEICEAPFSLQQELLAWIEEEDEAIGVRLISTASEQIESRVEQGRFRSDLFYRLNVLQVALPGLQQRRKDIPLLAEQFIEDLNDARGTQVQGLSGSALQLLLEVDFPGNVRQLRQVLKEAHQSCLGQLIDIDDLPPL